MVQPGMRVTVDAAMRARDVSRPAADLVVPADGGSSAESPAQGAGAESPAQGAGAGDPHGSAGDRHGKAERRRLGKRHARARR